MRALAISAALAVLAGSATADTAVLQAAADNTLYENKLGEVSNGSGAYFFVGDTGSFGARRGLVRFDVAGSVPAGSTITSASLRLHMSRTRVGAFDIYVARVLSAWGEGISDAGDPGGAGTIAEAGDATWIHRSYPSVNWATPGGDFAPGGASAVTLVDAVGFYTWSGSAILISDVQSWLNDPATNHGWILVGLEAGDRTAKRFDSRENVDPLVRPTLTIEFTPPPPACAGDTNGDGDTNGADLSVLLGQFGTSVPPGTGGDLNDDGLVNAADLSVLLADFGCE